MRKLSTFIKKIYMKNLKSIYGHLFTAAFSLAISVLFGLPAIAVFIGLTAMAFVMPQGLSLYSVVSNPLIGRARGSMGGATFSTWKGLNVLKNKATSVANPQTGAQLAQRSAFAQMVYIFRLIPGVVKAGFKKLAVGMSEFNAFASAVLDEAWDMSAPPAATLIPALIKISKGTIATPVIATIVADRSLNTVVITWASSPLQPGQSATDKSLVAIYDATFNDWIGYVDSAEFQDNTASVALPAAWSTGDSLFVYLGFYNQLTGASSDSNNDTATIVA